MNHTEFVVEKRLLEALDSRDAILFHLEREIEVPVRLPNRINKSLGKFTAKVQVVDTICCIKDGRRWRVGIAPQSVSDRYSRKEGNRIAFLNATSASEPLTVTDAIALIKGNPAKGNYVGRKGHGLEESLTHMKELLKRNSK